MSVQLHRFLSRTEITNLATKIANTKIDGAKIKARSFLKLLASLSGFSSSEAYLNDIEKARELAFEIITQEVVFDYSDSVKGKLVGVSLEIKVKGYWSSNIRIMDAIIDDAGYLMKCEVRANIGGGESENPIITVNERMESNQIALNYAFGTSEWINSNIKQLKPSDFDGWKISTIGLSKTAH